MANGDWTRMQIVSLVGTVVLTMVAIFFSVISIRSEDYFVLAISMGAVGGLVHEFAQSGGKILFFKKADDGVYLGSISGMILGAVAGILVIKGQLVVLENPAMDFSAYELATDVFFAGLGLKGVSEAATGSMVE